jgi:hypothetical protein
MSQKVLDVENNEMVSEKEFLSNKENIIIEYDGKKVGFNFKTYERYVKKPDSDAVFVPCVFVDAAEYNAERNFLKENESIIDEKLKEFDTNNDQKLTQKQVYAFFESFDIDKQKIDEVFEKENKNKLILEEKQKKLNEIAKNLKMWEKFSVSYNDAHLDEVIVKGKEEKKQLEEDIEKLQNAKVSFSDVKNIFSKFEHIINFADYFEWNKNYDKIKIFQNETEQEFKKKFKKYLNIASFGFFKSNAMILFDELSNSFTKNLRFIVLKKTKNKMSFVNQSLTLHNPDFYTNLQISELINESGLNGFDIRSMQTFKANNKIFQSLKREFFTGPTNAGRKVMKSFQAFGLGAGVKYFSGMNRSLYSKFTEDNFVITDEFKEGIKELDEIFVNVAPRSKDVITVFRAGPPLSHKHNPAFLSTTTDMRVVAQGFHNGDGKNTNIMEIKIRPGTPYLVLDINHAEREILLPRGLFFKELGRKKKLFWTKDITQIENNVTEYEAYLPKYDPNDPVNIKMETPHYNKYYDEVCKDFHVLEVDVAGEKSPSKSKSKSGTSKSSSKGKRKTNKKSSSGNGTIH